MKKIGVFVSFLLLVFALKAQPIRFSDSLDVFYRQAVTSLQRIGSESANKVAYDFKNAWDGKFTNLQKTEIHSIALQMQKKGYPYRPFFLHFLSYLAFADAQAHLNTDQITQVIGINQKMVKSLDGREYQNFLLGLNTFMARRLLWRTKSVLAATEEGSFEFKIYNESAVEPEPIPEEPTPVVEEVESNPATTETTTDTWGDQASDDTGDDWGTDDSWDSGDSWGTDDSGTDDWGTDDTWTTDDTWGKQRMQDKSPKPVNMRQKVVILAQDYVQAKRSLYIHPDTDGPGIALENNSMLISTPYDSFNIKETDGVYLLKNRVYAGKNGVINWPEGNKRASGAVINLEKWMLRPDRPDFWTPNATLTFDKLLDAPVQGVFEFNSVRRKPGTTSNYPRFTSNDADIMVRLSGDKVTYTGGIQISGNDFAGTSVSRKKGTLGIKDDLGNSIVFRAEKFLFEEDSVISSNDASFTVYHGIDSMYHPAVKMKYDTKTQVLSVLRKDSYEVTPFTSTYFQMNINADLITWDTKTDSVNISILNGKEMIPVTLESKDFFSKVRFSKLGAGFQFHPVITSVYYCNKYSTREFVDTELATEFGITEKEAKGAMNVLEKYGFARYNHETGQVVMKEKAFLYYKASANKIDYDNIMIPSHEPQEPNVTWMLDSGELKVRGVERFYLTSDFKTFIEPTDGEVKVGEGRKLIFDGMLEAGEFQYKGKNFKFDYNGFLIEMDNIDSIRINIDIPDSLAEGPEGTKKSLSNHLNRTSGTIYLNRPDNKSGLKRDNRYPYLVSDSEATVYFDGPEILNGAYDKSVRFIVPPFEADSSANSNQVTYDGVFNSGGIFPNFEENLHLMPDQSLGFNHQIPTEGYNLYGTAAKTYQQIRLDNNGIRGGGKIDFITSTIFSDDFVYYPDSVASVGLKGEVRPGNANAASYPKVVIGPYRMHWEPRIDSMHLENLREPFDFYNGTATLDGAINITARGLFGIGKLKTLGSRLNSTNIAFTETTYNARNADFEVLTDIPNKPAMKGDDIRINFDLMERLAYLSPEKKGVAAISFPYAQMNTSITNAVWDLDNSLVTMTKPENVPIENSYFYTTREELDSLAFNAEEAVYDMKSKALTVKGIPYIIVADAKIIPQNNQTTIYENAQLQTLTKAEIIIDTLHGYHQLYNGEIKILSRNEYSGSADYKITFEDQSYDIKFNDFNIKSVKLPDGSRQKMTVSGGFVPPESHVIVAPGFYYKGDVEMFAYKEALELRGYVKLMRKDPMYDYWIKFRREDENTQIEINIEDATFEDNEPVISGLHYNLRDEIYASFVEQRESPSDEDFFTPKGILSYDTTSMAYKIEAPKKSTGDSYQGYTMIYNDRTKDVVFEGPASFFGPLTKGIGIEASVLGVGNDSTGNYSMDALLALDLGDSESFMRVMALDLLDMIQRLGSPVANDLSIQLMYKLANITSDQTARTYETTSLKEYTPLYMSSDALLKSLVISGVKLKWSKEHNAWYNTTKIGISNIFKNDVNAKMDGFMEIKKDETGNDVFNLFIQAAPGTWFFISYANNTLLTYAASPDYNDQVEAKSNYGKAKPGEMVLVKGDQNETLSFVNTFREKYFGITDPYDLVSPDDISLDDEGFETIKKDNDFGF